MCTIFLGRNEDDFILYVLDSIHMHMHTQSLVIKIELNNQFNLKTCQLCKITNMVSFYLNLWNVLYQLVSVKKIKIVACVQRAQGVYHYS